MKKTYIEWVHWLESRNIMPQIRPGLKHTEAALNEAGVLEKVDPQKVIHIAGTNGKGTTAKSLERLLSSQGLKVGLYTSPHLVETTERICINDKQITKNQLVTYCERYQALIEKWNLSHFESLTLFSASLFFKDEPVDYAIYEIGLGGTWDATNVIPHNTSVITALGFDHQHILGNTLGEIANNKFGIIKNNNAVFHLPYDKDIEDQLQEKILSTNSKVHKITSPELVVQKTSTLPKYFIQHNNQLFEISLPGPRAAQNMWLALQVFSSFGFQIESGLRELKKVQWPARMTLLSQNTICPVYLSGDHNLQGIDSLKEILKDSTYSKIKILLGLSKNRSHEEFIQSLQEIPNSEIYLTKPHFNGVAPTNSNLPYYSKPADGLHDILKNSTPGDMIVVTGSLYLCGDILREFSVSRI